MRERKGRTPKRPANMTVARGDEPAVSWRWFEPAALALLLAYVPAVLAAVAALTQTAHGGAVGPAWRTPAAAAALAFVIAATWGMAAVVVNSTTVRVAGGWLEARHHPLYWPGGRRFRAADVEGIDVREDRNSDEGREDIITYRLMVSLRGTYPRTLVAGLPDRDGADYLRDRLLAGLRRP